MSLETDAASADPLLLLGPDRAEEFATLLRAAYRSNLDLGVRFHASEATDEEIERHLRENLAYGLEDEQGALLGTVSLRTPWGPNPGYFGLPHVGWLATDPAHAGKGLGRRLMRALEQQVLIGQLHAPAVSLGTAQEHPWLGAFYLRLGYERVGARDLGLGHVTDFYIRPLDHAAYTGWRERRADLLKGLVP